MASPSILLLDCSQSLKENLLQQGFDVESGTVGFISGKKQLPCQIYEKDIIIYNPDESEINEDFADGEIVDLTPQFKIGELYAHVRRGAIVLAFVKSLTPKYSKSRPYYWIPEIPQMTATMDKKINVISSPWLAPLLILGNLKLPVTIKIDRSQGVAMQGLYFNNNKDNLGMHYAVGLGDIFLLPDFISNEDVIQAFLHRVLPEMREYKSKEQLIEKFSSPYEKSAKQDLISLKEEQLKLDERLLNKKEELANYNRQKFATIKVDDTAILILNYYDIAIQQQDVSMFYLYKVIEALEMRLGGEKAAKNSLKQNESWNYIGKLANASYADIRHAPKPGEKIKQWTDVEIKKAFKCAEEIIQVYIQTLF